MSGDDLTDDWALGGENVNASERASYVPTWYTATMVPASARGPLTFDLDVEVCVIGAGLAGLTAAREIARRGWSLMPGSAFSDLACRSSIKRMAAASMSRAAEASVVDLKFLPLYQQARMGTSNPKPGVPQGFAKSGAGTLVS